MRRSRTSSRVRPALVGLAALALALPLAAQARPAAAAATCTHSGSVVTCTYGVTGAAETWVVPPGVTQAAFQVVGAPGGRSGGSGYPHVDGGRGADLKATLTLVPGTPVIVTVGGPGGTDGNEAGGFNGGGGGLYIGNTYDLAGGGGGASDVRIGGTGLADRVLVAGGGGGGGSYGEGNGPAGMGGVAGGAGGDAGAAGVNGSADGTAGGGGGGGAGSAAAGGGGGTAGSGYGGVAGGTGVLGQGANVVYGGVGSGIGGGGGGGLFGGGSGGSGGQDLYTDSQDNTVDVFGAGGGGGGGASGYTTGFGITGVSLGVDTTRVPKVVITYTDTTAPSVTVNQAAGQADPATSNPVLFTAVFDEAVTGFSASGVTLGGTADLSKAAITISGGPSSYTISVDGVAGNGTVTAAVAANAATDFAGNGSSASTSTDNSVTFVSDSTPPVITPNVAGTLGQNGWYVSNVTLTWTVSDPESTVTSTTGCDPQSITSDTAGTTFTCTATSAGGTSAPKSVTIKRDATAPSVASGTPDLAPNAAGWYNAPVKVTFAGSDATSGIASCTSPTYSGPDSANTSVGGTCTDNAGNVSSPVGFGLKYDATAPVLAPAVTPNPASLNLPATASPNATDATSGVASASCTQPNTASTGLKSVSCTAADNAGNTAAANASYSVIDNPPTIAVAPGGTCAADGSAAGSIKLTVGDINTGPNGLTLRVVSSTNTQLVPNSKVLFAGTGANRTMSVTATAKKSGTAVLTIGVSDGTNTTTLVVTVQVISSRVATLTGTAGTDMLFGGNAVDTLNGLGGSDLLCGGNGSDRLNGGEGADTLYGNRGDDSLTGGTGADFFSGGQGTDCATDFTPSQGDTKDGTVEKVTTIVAAGAALDTGTPAIIDQLFLPAVQH